jgi:predicted regulator of Ras-like GTPase activity (Roadblock/LC7/MglB family)
MTVPIQHRLSPEAQEFNWLLTEFAASTPGVGHAIAVSSDGLLIAASQHLERDGADRLAAITSAFVSLANGASRVYDLAGTNKVVVDYEQGYLLVSSIGVSLALGVLAARTANLGTLAYEMAMFANRAGGTLTPQLIDELKATVGE